MIQGKKQIGDRNVELSHPFLSYMFCYLCRCNIPRFQNEIFFSSTPPHSNITICLHKNKYI